MEAPADTNNRRPGRPRTGGPKLGAYFLLEHKDHEALLTISRLSNLSMSELVRRCLRLGLAHAASSDYATGDTVTAATGNTGNAGAETVGNA